MKEDSLDVTRVVRDEAWRSERIVNRFRSVVWLAVGLLSLTLDVALLGKLGAAGLVTTAWGLTCATVVAALLRHGFHSVVPAAITVFDLVVLGVTMDATQTMLKADLPAQAPHQLHGTTAGVLTILATNALRYSWRASLVTVPAGVAVVLLVHYRHAGLTIQNLFDVILVTFGGVLAAHASRRLQIVARRIKERDALARFLPAPLVEQVARNPMALDLGGQEIEATVLFADIRAFTTLAADMEPARVVALLNEYLEEMVDEVFRHGGTLDKYVGDGICAVFGPPLPERDRAPHAVACARGMLARLERLNERRRGRGEPPLAIGIGLHAGRVLAGRIGTSARMEYTHIGDAMNTASRIEGLCKELRSPLLMSRDVRDRAGAQAAAARSLGPAAIRGKADPIEIFALDGAGTESAPGQ